MKQFLFGAGLFLSVVLGTAGAQTQGGGIVVTYKDDISTLDPAIGYDWQNFSIIKAMFSGLMDYEPGTATLTPNLATDSATGSRPRSSSRSQAARRTSRSSRAVRSFRRAT